MTDELEYKFQQEVRKVLQSVALHGYDLICAEADIIKSIHKYHEAKLKEITDADIEAWAKEEIERQRKGFKAMNDELPISFDSWMAGLKHCKIISAKALRDGEIKHIEK